MIPKAAFEKAIKGGWHEGYEIAYVLDDGAVLLKSTKSVRSIALVNAEIVLDPTFWQALGKALVWEKLEYHSDGSYDGWHYYATRFINLILTGGDTEKYWNDLLTL